VLAGLWGPVQRWVQGAGPETSPVFRKVGTRLA
jgi:hypothetical protein